MNAKRKFGIHDLVTVLSLVVILTLGTLMVAQVADATIYTVSYQVQTYQTTGNLMGNYLVFAHTFVGRQDTCYLPFPGKQYFHANSTYTDTLLGQFDISTIAGADSMNVKYGIQYSDDNTNWYPTFPGTTLYTDSSATGTAGLFHTVLAGWYNYGNVHPYYRITVTGLTPSGGKANKAGVISKAFLFGF